MQLVAESKSNYTSKCYELSHWMRIERAKLRLQIKIINSLAYELAFKQSSSLIISIDGL